MHSQSQLFAFAEQAPKWLNRCEGLSEYWQMWRKKQLLEFVVNADKYGGFSSACC
jgi:hypothetical protein